MHQVNDNRLVSLEVVAPRLLAQFEVRSAIRLNVLYDGLFLD